MSGSLAEFQRKIESDIAERETVLSEIERVLFTKRYKLNKKHYDIFSLHSVAMIYAIWEGFVQTAFKLIIDYVNTQHIAPDRLNDSIYIHHAESTFNQLNNYPIKKDKKIRFLNKLKDFFLQNPVRLNRGINTKSNVGFDVLNNLLKQFNIEPFPEWWHTDNLSEKINLKQSLTDFLKYRNRVAHGEDLSEMNVITKEVYSKYALLVKSLMFEIQLKMTDTIAHNRFVKN